MSRKTDVVTAQRVLAWLRSGRRTVTAAAEKFGLSVPTICRIAQVGFAPDEWEAIKRLNLESRPVRPAGELARALIGQRFGRLVVLDVVLQERRKSGARGSTTRTLLSCACDTL